MCAWMTAPRKRSSRRILLYSWINRLARDAPNRALMITRISSSQSVRVILDTFTFRAEDVQTLILSLSWIHLLTPLGRLKFHNGGAAPWPVEGRRPSAEVSRRGLRRGLRRLRSRPAILRRLRAMTSQSRVPRARCCSRRRRSRVHAERLRTIHAAFAWYAVASNRGRT